MKRTTPSDSPLHRGSDQCENCSHATAPRLLPLPKGRAMDAPKHRDAILPLPKGRETNARNCSHATMQRLLPLPKGEPEGVLDKIKTKR